MKPVLSSDAVRILGSDVIDLLHQHFHGYTTSVMTYAQFTRACATFGFVTTTSLQKAYRRHSCGAGLTFDDFLASVCSLEGSSQSRPWASPQVAKALRDRCMRGRVGAATSINASAQRLRAAFKQPGGVTHFSSALDDFERRCKRLSSGAQTSKGPHVTNNRRRNLVSSPFVQAVFKTASVPLKRMWTEFCGSGHTVSSRRGFMTCDKWVKVAGFLGIPYAEARDVFDQGQHGAQKEESKMSYDGFQAALCYWCQKQCPPQLGEGSDVSCARRLRKLLLEDVDVRSIQLSHRIHTYLHPDPITDLLRVSAHAVAEPRTHAAELATKIAEVEDREVAVHAMELVRVLETEGDVQGAYETLVAHAMTVKPKSAAAHFAPLLRKNPQQQPSRIPAPKSTVSSVKKSRPLGVTSSAVRDKNVRPHVKAPPSSAISGRPPLPPPKMKQATVAPAAVKNGTNGPSPSNKPHPVRIPPPLDEMTATPTARAARESIPGLTPVSTVNTPSSMACSWHLPTPTAQVAVRDSVHDLRDSVNELKLAIERQDEVLACELLECIAEQAAGMAQETDACGSVDTPLVQSLSPVALDCASPSSQHYTSPSKHSGGSPSAHSSAHRGVNSDTRMSVRASVSESLGNDCGRSVSSGLSEEVHTVASSPRMRGSVKVEIMSSPRSQKSVDCVLLGEDIGHASHRGSVRATRSADGPQKGHLCSPTENTSVSVRVQECESVLRHSSPEQRSPPSPALISSIGPSVSVSQAASRAKEGLAITSPSSISCPVMRNNDEYEDTRPVHQRTAEDVLVHPSSPPTDAARQREQLDAANAAVQHAGTKDDVAAPSPFSPPGRRQPDECASARSSLKQSIIVADTSSPLERSLSGKKENVSKLLESLSKEADATPRSVECTSNSSQHSARSNAQGEPDNAHHVHDGEQGVAPYADAGVMQEDAASRMRGWKTGVEECEERIRRRSSCSVNPEPFDKSAEDLYDKSSSEGDSKHAIAMSRWEIDSVKMGWASLRADMQRALDCAWQERSSRLSVMHIEYVVDWDAMTLGKADGAPPRRLRRIMTDSDPLDVSFDVAKASDDLKGHVDGERNANDNVSDDTIEDDMNFTLEPVHIPALRAALGTLRSYRYDPEAGQDVIL